MRIAICDDEQVFIDQICTRINNISKTRNIDCQIQTFTTGETLLEECKKDGFDAVFLDIAMPDIDGFEVAKKLSKLSPDINLIFVSSKESLVFSSYEYSPLWFVPKSQLQLLETAVNKIISKTENKALEKKLFPLQIEKNTMVKLSLTNVLYIKSTAHYLNIYFANNVQPSESYRNSLNKVEALLKNHFFVRCHSRYLVNCRNISKIQSGFCILHNEERIPISRNKMAATKECFQNYLRSI